MLIAAWTVVVLLALGVAALFFIEHRLSKVEGYLCSMMHTNEERLIREARR